MEKLETIELQTARETIGVINKLLAIPLGEQLYRRELKLLFDTLELISKPIFVVDNL